MEHNENYNQQKDIDEQREHAQQRVAPSVPAAQLATVLNRLGLSATSPQMERSLVEALQDANATVRMAALQALAKSGGEQGNQIPVEPLLAMLHDPEWSIRALTALTLRQAAARVPVEPLLEALNDTDASVRAAVVRALGAMGERVPVQVLEQALSDPSWQVREAAELSLAEWKQSLSPMMAQRASQQEIEPQPERELTQYSDGKAEHWLARWRRIRQRQTQAGKRDQSDIKNSRRQRTITDQKMDSGRMGPSRRAVVVGIAAVVVVGNGVLWSLLIRSLRNRQPGPGTSTGSRPQAINFYGPGYIAVDVEGNLYVMDADAQNTHARIVKLSPTGDVLAQWHTLNASNQPISIAVDGQGNVYVSAQVPQRLYKLSPTGQILAQWPITGLHPAGIALDKQGNIYIAILGDNTIEKYSPEGKLLATWGSLGHGQTLYSPLSIAIDAHDNLFVAEEGDNRI
ncbi:MAG TPA: HEAT repeat domain-containing protein, partial [Ktedonobacteraceae bacterium]|nr:HEAT repeat domain-containing protein [Ktedonobacteraceae bacterium]